MTNNQPTEKYTNNDTSLLQVENNFYNTLDNSLERLSSDQLDKLAAALSKAQGAMENARRTKQGYGYKYADLADCIEAARPALTENGLAVNHLVTENSEGLPVIIAVLSHESGQWMKNVIVVKQEWLVPVVTKEGKVRSNPLQTLTAVITSCKRCTFAALVGLATEDDDAEILTREDPQTTKNGDLVLVQQFRKLVKDKNIDFREFVEANKISSDNIESIKRGIKLLQEKHGDTQFTEKVA